MQLIVKQHSVEPDGPCEPRGDTRTKSKSTESERSLETDPSPTATPREAENTDFQDGERSLSAGEGLTQRSLQMLQRGYLAVLSALSNMYPCAPPSSTPSEPGSPAQEFRLLVAFTPRADDDAVWSETRFRHETHERSDAVVKNLGGSAQAGSGRKSSGLL